MNWAFAWLLALMLGADADQELTLLKAENAILKRDIKQKADRITELEGQIAALEAEVTRLKKMLDDVGLSPEKAKKPEKPQEDIWKKFPLLEFGKNAVRISESLTLNNLKITPKSIDLRRFRGKVPDFWGGGQFRRNLIEKGGWRTTDKPILVLTCEFENVSKGQIFHPKQDAEYGKAEMTDNFGNRTIVADPVSVPLGSPGTGGAPGDYRSAIFATCGWWSVEYDRQHFRELRAGESITVVFLGQPPKVDNARAFVWPMSLRTMLGDEGVRDINIAILRADFEKTKP